MRATRPRRALACTLLSYGSFLLLLAVVTAGLLVPGCREQSSAPVDRNAAPQTVLVGVPGDSTTTFYQVHLFWNGTDVDGEVVGYEWAITDSLPEGDELPYEYTTRTDSVFIFTVEESREILGHRFYVRAVDNEGKPDPTPAFTFFSVRNTCIPTSWFTRSEAQGPNGEVIEITSTNERIPTDTIPAGWSVCFSWEGEDCDRALNPDGTIDSVGQIAGYTYHLAPLELNYLGGELADTSYCYEAERLASNTYTMYIRARDNAGLSQLDPTIRTFVWNYDPITWFSRALLEGETDSVEVFYASVSGTAPEDFEPYTRGDTLPLTADGVKVEAHVRAADPDAPRQITAYQARLILDSGFWRDLPPDRKFTNYNQNYTGAYKLMARAMDALGRWDGTPDTIRFDVNRPSRFVRDWIYYSIPQQQIPLPTEIYQIAPGDTTFLVRFAAYDPDLVSGVTAGVQFTYRFDRYPLPGGSSGTESFFREWATGEFVIQGGDLPAISVWTTRIRRVNGEALLPGEYVLVVQGREAFVDEAQRSRFGSRTTERFIGFQLEY